MSKEKYDLVYLANYEIRSSWWAGKISNPYLQELAGRYFAAKVRRKVARMKFGDYVREKYKAM